MGSYLAIALSNLDQKLDHEELVPLTTSMLRILLARLSFTTALEKKAVYRQPFSKLVSVAEAEMSLSGVFLLFTISQNYAAAPYHDLKVDLLYTVSTDISK